MNSTMQPAHLPCSPRSPSPLPQLARRWPVCMAAACRMGEPSLRSTPPAAAVPGGLLVFVIRDRLRAAAAVRLAGAMAAARRNRRCSGAAALVAGAPGPQPAAGLMYSLVCQRHGGACRPRMTCDHGPTGQAHGVVVLRLIEHHEPTAVCRRLPVVNC